MNHAEHMSLPIAGDEDVVRVRQVVRTEAIALGFSLVEQTKLVTAASELARNTLQHAGGGDVLLERVSNGMRQGLKLTFVDRGPGIADIGRALADGFSTAGGLGLGLGGAKRLVNEFEIASQVGHGTRVAITRWR